MILKALIVSSLATFAAFNSSYGHAADIEIEGTSLQQQVHCNQNNLIITGADNHIKASGHCQRIELTGADSTVYAESVSQIHIVGADSRVWYQTSPNKQGKAFVKITGAGSYAQKQSVR